MAIVDLPDDPEHLGRLTVLVGIPATAVLNPNRLLDLTTLRMQQIFDGERYAVAVVLRRRAHDGVVSAGEVIRIEQVCITPPGSDLAVVGDVDDLCHVIAPHDAIAGDIPMIGRLTHCDHGAPDALQFAEVTGLGNRLHGLSRARWGAFPGWIRFGLGHVGLIHGASAYDRQDSRLRPAEDTASPSYDCNGGKLTVKS